MRADTVKRLLKETPYKILDEFDTKRGRITIIHPVGGFVSLVHEYTDEANFEVYVITPNSIHDTRVRMGIEK